MITRFTGKERDTETGLDFFQARYYGSSMGRFMSPDPGNAGATEDDPQSWNGYTYALNNPLLYTDPDGREPCKNGINPNNGNTCTTVVDKKKPDKIGDDAIKRFAIWTGTVNAKLDKALGRWYVALQNVIDLTTPCSRQDQNVSCGVVLPTGKLGAEAGVEEGAAIEAANGTTVTGFAEHGVNRAIGEGAPGTAGVRAGTKPQAILDALKNPKAIRSGIDSQGRPFKVYTGKDARVIVNPQSGKIISVNPTSGAGAH